MFGMLSANGYINSRTQQCFDDTLSFMSQDRLNDGRSRYRLRKSVDRVTNIFAGRNWHCQYMLDNNCDYLMIIDSDMTFAPDAVTKLISYEKDIISGLAFTKKPPYNPVMQVRSESSDLDEYNFVVNWVDNSMVKVDNVGTAFLLIKRKVLETIEGPWFCHISSIDAAKLKASDKLILQLKGGMSVDLALAQYNKIVDLAYDRQEIHRQNKIKNNQNYKGPSVVGSDYFFCKKAVKVGFEIWVDTSIKLGHLGEWEFDIEDYKTWGGPVKDKSTQKDVSTDYDTIAEFARKSHDTRRSA